MGMDGVEILVEVEETFGIALDDGEVARVETVGDLCDLVLSRVPRAEQERCLTALAFWRLRAALGKFGVERSRVRPDTRLADVVWSGGQRMAERRAAWARLSEALGLDLPPLVRSRTLVAIGLTSCLAAFVAAWFTGGSVWLATAGATGLGALFGVLTRSRRGYPRASIATIGGLARALVVRQAARVAAPAGGFTAPQVEAIVARIIAEHQALPLRRVTRGARFVDDLGIA